MDVEKVALFAGVGFALAVGAFVLWGPSPKPRRRGQVTGIHNLGHTCFLNALLQALAACPIFLAWLQKQHDKNKLDNFTSTLFSVLKKINGYTDDLYGDVTPIEIISSLGPLWNFTPGHQDVHELFHVVLGALQNEAQPSNRKGGLSDALPAAEPEKIASPVDLKGAGDSLNVRSVSCNDITAAEKHHDRCSNHHSNHTPNGFDKNYNNHIASSTHSISNVPMGLNKPGMILARSTDIIPINAMFGNNENGMDEKFKRQWNSLHAIPLVRIPPLSNEVHPFSGLLTSQLQCTNCDWKSSVRYDKFENVFLPLPPNGGPLSWKRFKLSELFLRFVASEIVHDVLCDGCGIRCPAIKTLTLGKLPKCLCLHIPRSNWSNSGMLIKRDDHVIFPEILVLDPFTFTETKKRNTSLQNGTQHSSMLMMNHSTPTHGKHRYELRAVVEHRGSDGDSGHFVCYRRGNNPGQWFYTSDTTVENTSLSDVLSASPYLLFYERINESIE